MENINLRIQKLRKALGLNQESFSKILSLSQGHYSAIESGKTAITDRLLVQIQNIIWPNGMTVNMKWLRDNEDEDMFLKLDPDLELMNAVGKISEDEDELIKTILLEYSKLDEEDKMKVCKFIFSISESARASYQKILDKQKKEKD